MRPRALLEAGSDNAPILLVGAMLGKGRSYATTNDAMALGNGTGAATPTYGFVH
jgi:hypothetical protein